MVQHPILVNRPIVVTPRGARLCRPSEAVLDLLDNKPASFAKEDGRSCGSSSRAASGHIEVHNGSEGLTPVRA